MMVDLDEPNELFDWKSNKINIISDESGDDGDRRATSNGSESEISQWVLWNETEVFKATFPFESFLCTCRKKTCSDAKHLKWKINKGTTIPQSDVCLSWKF